ncbi:catechol 2,3-dioxygenase-like lactoylglutathione lyase family enzyme [Kribbella orskensis]|uniref:Catechol 2,3-dioxygenase-like lactoylglutathione lyase family enzyme n=2 Tax=Kribbellaceae TaxID=2726069 RepID=A0ABY2BNS6_9ACTN|nr:catechol 2,3-dioxygenase-like lactoylglutathione lyase family enzyme [Kribbella sp. VKM Ac-2500]TCO23140.1 catechol 2,3-dioxygenase-like lactoylglutathione lyase family enzyme [Kribbella orskensis]
MIAVTDVEKSSAWYCELLGAASGHGGPEYEQIVVDGELILQLHRKESEHHHGTIGDPDQPLGNGVALWFGLASPDSTGPLDSAGSPASLREAAARAAAMGATIQTGVHLNPNAHHHELWLRDPDGYLVVLAS